MGDGREEQTPSFHSSSPNHVFSMCRRSAWLGFGGGGGRLPYVCGRMSGNGLFVVVFVRFCLETVNGLAEGRGGGGFG